MHYAEHAPAPQAAPFIRAIWTLKGNAASGDWLSFDAMPDGCLEIIHRTAGRSIWHGEQPELFVAGVCTGPARLEFTGDAQFTGVRLWPWTWNRIGQPPAAKLLDRWSGLSGHPLFEDFDRAQGRIVERVTGLLSSLSPDPIGRTIPSATCPGEIALASRRSERTVQRWFRSEIGMTARQYLRLLRFQGAIQDDGMAANKGLADQAAAFGYSDQAHMARDFRSFSGRTARTVRSSAKGPFVER